MTDNTINYTQSDELVRDFVTRGLTVLSPHSLGIPLAVHEEIYEKEKTLFRQKQRITAQVLPEILDVLNAPGVVDACRQLAGDNFAIVPFTHNTPFMSGPYDQHWHKDDTGPLNLRKQRHHQAIQIEMLYYPQAVGLDMGPTATVPYSQYWTFDHEENLDNFAGADHLDFAYQTGGMERVEISGPKSTYDQKDVINRTTAHDIRMRDVVLNLNWPLCQPFEAGPLEAGSVILYSHNLLHRSNHRRDDWRGWRENPRFMWRFWVYRTTEPTAADDYRLKVEHVAAADDLTCQNLLDTTEDVLSVWRTQDRWLQSGQFTAPSDQSTSIELLAKQLHNLGDEEEPKRIGAAYRLAESSSREEAVTLLSKALQDEKESTRRAALFGLIAIGPAITDSLLPLMNSDRKWVRRGATFALGSAGKLSIDTVLALRERFLNDGSAYVRSVAADALGCFSRRAVAEAATDHLVQHCASAIVESLEIETNRLGMDRAQGKSIKFVRPIDDCDVCEGMGMTYEQDDRFEPVRSVVRENSLWALVIICSHGESVLGDALSPVIDMAKKIVKEDTNIFSVGLALDVLQRLVSLTPRSKRSNQTLKLKEEMTSLFDHIPIHPMESLLVSGMSRKVMSKYFMETPGE